MDSVTCGAYANRTTTPVLLTRTEALDASTSAALDEIGATDATICGGEFAVSAQVAEDLRGAGLDVDRVFGATRVETAVAVAEQLFGHSSAAGDTYLLVNGFDDTSVGVWPPRRWPGRWARRSCWSDRTSRRTATTRHSRRATPSATSRPSAAAPVGVVYQRVGPHVGAVVDLAPSGQITRLEELRAYEPLASCPPAVARMIVAETLGEVMGDPRGRSADWLETLEALVEAAGDVSVAAERLHVTARTVYFRLESIREVSGLDLGEPGVMFRVGLAVYLYRLHRAGLQSPDDPAWRTAD